MLAHLKKFLERRKPPADPRRRRGAAAEELAAKHIRKHGGRIADRNWKCRAGELDLIVLDGEDLAFVEVKSRASTEFGQPSDAVNRAKRRRIERLAQHYIQYKRLDPQTWRFDIVEVTWSEPPTVQWHRGAWRQGQ